MEVKRRGGPERRPECLSVGQPVLGLASLLLALFKLVFRNQSAEGFGQLAPQNLVIRLQRGRAQLSAEGC